MKKDMIQFMILGGALKFNMYIYIYMYNTSKRKRLTRRRSSKIRKTRRRSSRSRTYKYKKKRNMNYSKIGGGDVTVFQPDQNEEYVRELFRDAAGDYEYIKSDIVFRILTETEGIEQLDDDEAKDLIVETSIVPEEAFDSLVKKVVLTE